METPKGRELITIAATTLGLLALSFLAFTSPQKKAIRERDGNKCQFPADHPCNGKAQLQVHHIIPQRYAKEVGINPDFGENGISLCPISHQEKVHPDMHEAQKRYHKDSNSYHKAFENRDKSLREKKIYWNTTWDRIFHSIAIKNTQVAINGGWRFPSKDEK